MTKAYEKARTTVQHFIGAEFSQEVIFTPGTTFGINAIAFCFGEKYIRPGDEILVSEMEHHSNLVPWQMMCDRKKARLRMIPFDDRGELDLEAYRKLFNERTKLVAICHVSNTLGTINPVKEMIKTAHAAGAKVLIDGAQSVQHFKVDVQDMDCDFFAFSGHKIYGPTGIGVLYGKRSLLMDLPPYQGGGDMVECVSFEKTTYNDLPFKFEAGTPPFIQAVGLATAIEYVIETGLDKIGAYEHHLLEVATEKLQKIEGIKIYGEAREKSGILSFLIGNIHPYDLGMVLDKMGIAVRTGTHCTQPVMDHFGIDGTVRVSLAFYNTEAEMEALSQGIIRARRMFL
jgi:cysteine desulfurase/selenocysteine lyase